MMKKGCSNVIQMSQQCENAFLLFIIPNLKQTKQKRKTIQYLLSSLVLEMYQ